MSEEKNSACNEIKINVTKYADCDTVKVNVKPVPVNPVVVENSYRGIDYNVLKNKPQIEGVELVGNKTAKELLGFDKTDMDATVAKATKAEETADQAEQKAETALSTANEAKATADGLDSKVTEAKETATEALEKSKEAIGATEDLSNSVTTLRNDVDELGDQVHEIEAKIPSEASDSNQLADKAFVNDKIAAINFIKWVTELPTTGETKYLYAIARTEKDKEGHYIAALYVWDGRAWRGAGGYSLNIDPDTIATKTYVTNITDVLSADIATNTTDIAKNAGDIAALDADKQDVISDLDTIRSGAAKGATALQSVPIATTTVAGIVKPDGKTVKVADDGTLTATADTSGYLPLTGGKLTGDLEMYGGDIIFDIYKGAGISFAAGPDIRGDSVNGHLLLSSSNKKGAVVINAPDGLYNKKTQKYFIDESKIGAANGVAGLDGNSLVPTANLPIDGSTITVNSDGKLSASGSAPDNMMTTNTFQEISARKDFNDSVYLNSEVRAKKITMQNGATGLVQTSTGVQLGDYSVPVEIETSLFNINTIHPNSGGIRPATLNGKQIATVDDISGAGGDDGIKGDYCTSYGILEAPNGILTNPSGMEVTLKQGVVLQLAGQDIKTMVSSDMSQTLTSTTDCDLFYVSGTSSLMEVAQIIYSKNEPDNGATGVLAWWNPDNGKWKFKSNDTGNVWKEAVATPIAHIHTNGTTITRIDHIGYRVMDDEIYALKSDIGGSGFDFEGTKAEFDAAVTAGTITDDSVSLITDDVSGDTVATKAELAAVDQNKADTALSNVLANIDYVVESKFPTADDPTWYRVYKSGWVEQGGKTTSVGFDISYAITLPKTMLNGDYIALTNYENTEQGDAILTHIMTKTTTTLTVGVRRVESAASGTRYILWEAKGMGANL